MRKVYNDKATVVSGCSGGFDDTNCDLDDLGTVFYKTTVTSAVRVLPGLIEPPAAHPATSVSVMIFQKMAQTFLTTKTIAVETSTFGYYVSFTSIFST